MELKLLFLDEVNNREELENKLNELDINIDYKLGVIGMIIDKDNRIVLQRRGPKASGDYNRLSDMGGAVEDNDMTFKEALIRELREECGNDFKVEFDGFICAFVKNYFDNRLDKQINRIFLVYKLNYIEGDFLINEPGKALGYEWHSVYDIPVSEVMETSLFINDLYLKNNK
jgi:ADP-ribose pyrophosphatase YjhB (NUDIX family)